MNKQTFSDTSGEVTQSIATLPRIEEAPLQDETRKTNNEIVEIHSYTEHNPLECNFIITPENPNKVFETQDVIVEPRTETTIPVDVLNPSPHSNKSYYFTVNFKNSRKHGRPIKY